jgi:hypothetical protein
VSVLRSISTAQRQALRLLAGSPFGCSEAILLAHGFKTELLAVLVRDGLASTQPGTTRAGRRRLEVVWVMITDAGRRALDRSTRWRRASDDRPLRSAGGSATAGSDAPADFGAHSLRAGFLTSAARRGASEFKMRDVPLHKSMDVPRGYMCDADLFHDHRCSRQFGRASAPMVPHFVRSVLRSHACREPAHDPGRDDNPVEAVGEAVWRLRTGKEEGVSTLVGRGQTGQKSGIVSRGRSQISGEKSGDRPKEGPRKNAEAGCIEAQELMWWLTYRCAGKIVGVVVIESGSLIHARMRAALGEADGADFCEGVNFGTPFQVRSATVQHRRHGGVNGRGKGRGQGL